MDSTIQATAPPPARVGALTHGQRRVLGSAAQDVDGYFIVLDDGQSPAPLHPRWFGPFTDPIRFQLSVQPDDYVEVWLRGGAVKITTKIRDCFGLRF